MRGASPVGPVWRDAAFWAVRTGRHAQNHRGSLLPPTPCPAPGSKAFPCPLLFTNPPAGGQRRKPLVSTRRNKLQASQPWDWETGVQRYARGSGELFRSGQTTPSPWGGGAGTGWPAPPSGSSPAKWERQPLTPAPPRAGVPAGRTLAFPASGNSRGSQESVVGISAP